VKSRILWLLVVIAAAAGFYYATIRPALTPSRPPLNRKINQEFRPAAIPPPALPEPKIDVPVLPLPLPSAVAPTARGAGANEDRRPAGMEVPIQPGATIDFSLGAPMIRSDATDKAAIEKAMKEMTEATKDLTFPPSAPAEKK
jgi:hypothetical protein